MCAEKNTLFARYIFLVNIIMLTDICVNISFFFFCLSSHFTQWNEVKAAYFFGCGQITLVNVSI